MEGTSRGKHVPEKKTVVGLCTLHHGRTVLLVRERWKLGGNHYVELFFSCISLQQDGHQARLESLMP